VGLGVYYLGAVTRDLYQILQGDHSQALTDLPFNLSMAYQSARDFKNAEKDVSKIDTYLNDKVLPKLKKVQVKVFDKDAEELRKFKETVSSNRYFTAKGGKFLSKEETSKQENPLIKGFKKIIKYPFQFKVKIRVD